MAADELIRRINELAKKQKTIGLTPEEKEEQQRLRTRYLSLIRAQFQSQLDSILIEEADGSRHPLQKKQTH